VAFDPEISELTINSWLPLNRIDLGLQPDLDARTRGASCRRRMISRLKTSLGSMGVPRAFPQGETLPGH
jgi:hypothetical protein